MCDRIISKKYTLQNTNQTISFTANSINIPYKGPTTGLETSLRSSNQQQVTIKGKSSFDVEGEICDRDNFIETKAILFFENLNAGPYETVGSEIEFKNLYFHFRNLKIHLNLKFYFNPLSICRKIEETVSSKGNGSLMLLINEELGVEFDEYFVSDGEDEKNINDLFFDLEPFFKNYNSTFGIFFDSIVDKFEFNQEFGSLIRNEFVRLLCEHRKENPKSEEIPVFAFREKMNLLKEKDIYSVIKGGSLSRIGKFKPEI
jgi:hypothetical protein